MSERLPQLEASLRRAVEERRYSDVQEIAAEFCEQALADRRGLPPGDPRARQIFDKFRSVIEWARQMLCIDRATLASELRRAVLTHRYLTTRASASRLRFDI
ncbi:MAG TPA: hypothetical protein VMT86_14890 [Bryobacteraceae bacterium]|nr:hypothetical protein [Bryobacteraceae bacterium]